MSSGSSLDGYTAEQQAEPSLNLKYNRQGFCSPYPDYSYHCAEECISGEGCAPVVKLSPDLVVKYGAYVTVSEAESLLFIDEKAPGIPAPRVHGCYTIRPFDRDIEDCGSLYDTYIVMTFMEGRRLDEAWHELDENQKMSISVQLRTHLQEMRSISQDDDTMIGSVVKGPLLEPLLETHSSQSPFANEAEFNAALVSVHESVMWKANMRKNIEGALA